MNNRIFLHKGFNISIVSFLLFNIWHIHRICQNSISVDVFTRVMLRIRGGIVRNQIRILKCGRIRFSKYKKDLDPVQNFVGSRTGPEHQGLKFFINWTFFFENFIDQNNNTVSKYQFGRIRIFFFKGRIQIHFFRRSDPDPEHWFLHESGENRRDILPYKHWFLSKM